MTVTDGYNLEAAAKSLDKMQKGKFVTDYWYSIFLFINRFALHLQSNANMFGMKFCAVGKNSNQKLIFQEWKYTQTYRKNMEICFNKFMQNGWHICCIWSSYPSIIFIQETACKQQRCKGRIDSETEKHWTNETGSDKKSFCILNNQMSRTWDTL